MRSNGEYLTGLEFQNENNHQKNSQGYEEKNLPIFQQTIQWLEIYFSGKEPPFTPKYKIENGTPSHDCLSNIYAKLDAKKFVEVFIEWTKKIIKEKTGKVISIDGKAIKSATDKINGGNVPYIVSAFLGDIGLPIGQVKVEDKSNEITAIPELLDLIDIEGATITIDAIGTQEEIINKIVDKKAHYVLRVKDNQKE